MRAFTVLLSPNVQNLPVGFDSVGNPIMYAAGRTDLVSLDITDKVLEIGPWQRMCEKELTKIAPSEQVIRIIDMDGSIWAWLDANLPSISSSWQQNIMAASFPVNYFPPYLTIDLWDPETSAMKREFVGLIPNSAITRDLKTNEITFTPKDWSSQLANKPLTAAWPQGDTNPKLNPWLRPWPVAGLTEGSTASQVCSLTSISLTPGGYDNISWSGPDFLFVGNKVTTNLHTFYPAIPADKQYTVTAVNQVVGRDGPIPNWYCATLEGLGQEVWDHIHQFSALDLNFTVTCLTPAASPRSYFLVSKTILKDTKNVYLLNLDSVDGIVSGDTLTTIENSNIQTWTVLQVDAENLAITTKEEVQDVLAGTTKVFWDSDSSKTLVLEDARVLIKRAVTFPWAGYGVDFSRWVPQTLKDPLLMWLPLRPLNSDALTTVVDLDAGLTNPRVFGASSFAWTGNPEDGWVYTAGVAPLASWTEQTETMPTYAMPWEGGTIAPHSRARNRDSWSRSREKTEKDSDYRDPRDPVTVEVPEKVLCYSYQDMSRFLCTNSDTTASVVITPWGTTTWGTPAAAWNWPGRLFSAAPLIGHPGYYVGFSTTGLKVVKVSDHSVSNTCQVPRSADDADIKCTPYGNFLVGARGYGKISWDAGTNTVTLSWVTLANGTTSYMYPSSFQAITSTECCMLGRVSGTDDQGNTTTETHVFILSPSPDPNNANSSILNLPGEKVLDGVPKTVGVVRDPSLPGRVLGHCGGRLFSVSRTVTQAVAIERLKPEGMKAIDLLEQLGQVTNTILVPSPIGTMHVISRFEGSPTFLDVETTEAVQTYIWENFFSVVRVSANQDKNIYADAYGPAGGDILTVDGHPLIFTRSGCKALAAQLSSWIGRPRRYMETKWFWTNPDLPAPWESLEPLAVVLVGTDTTPWIVYGIDDSKFTGEASVKLVEAFPA